MITALPMDSVAWTVILFICKTIYKIQYKRVTTVSFVKSEVDNTSVQQQLDK